MKNDHRHRNRMFLSTLACALLLSSAAAAEAPPAAPKQTKPQAAAKPKPAPAKPAQAPPYGMAGGFIERHAEELGLSDETVKAMRETVEKSRKENERLRGQVEKAQEQMRTLLDKDMPDEAAVMAQAEKIGELVTAQRKNQLAAMLKTRAMLTPEQRAQLQQIRARHQPMMRRDGSGPPPHAPGGARAGAPRQAQQGKPKGPPPPPPAE